MKFNQKKIGYVLGSKVPQHEVGVHNGYVKYNPPNDSKDRSLLYLTGGNHEFMMQGEKPWIIETFEEAKIFKTFIDKVYKAALNDAGDDVVFLIQEM